MRVSASLNTPIRLPIETAFTIDVSALLDEGETIQGYNLYSFLQDRPQDLHALNFSETGELSFMPGETWEGYPTNFLDPEAFAGQLVLFTSGPRLIVVDILPSEPMPTTEPNLKGTAGRDTMVHDAQDPEGLSTALVDTSGGSDNASLVNGAGILLGRSGDDTLTGWDLDDALYGGGGLDVLFGGAGNDRLLGMNGNDRVFGGAGHDLMAGGTGDDSLTGGVGNDTLSAGPGNDTLRGETGDDSFEITYRTGEPSARPEQSLVAYGGEGSDRFEMAGENGHESRLPIFLLGDGGMVDLYGGAGDDRMYLREIAGGTLTGGDGADDITAGVADDAVGRATIYGGAGDDYLYGGRSTDVYGGIGSDYVSVTEGNKASTGDGDDTVYVQYDSMLEETATTGAEVYGGAGNDNINGGQRNDTMHGGLGNDTIYSYVGDDQLYGGAGDDSLAGSGGNDALYGGADNDILFSSDEVGYSEEQIMNGLAGMADTLYGGSGNDTITADRGGHMLYGDEGDDALTVTLANLYAASPSILNGGLGNDTLQAAGFSGVDGGDGADVFILDMNNTEANNIMSVSDFVRGEDKLDFLSAIGTSADTIAFINGELDPVDPTGVLTVAWQSGGSNRVDVQVDINGDGLYEGRFILTGVGDLLFTDFAPVFEL